MKMNLLFEKRWMLIALTLLSIVASITFYIWLWCVQPILFGLLHISLLLLMFTFYGETEYANNKDDA